jgi:hypothetical protein
MERKFLSQLKTLKRTFSSIEQGNFRRSPMLNFIKNTTTRAQNRIRKIETSQKSPIYKSPYDGPAEINKISNVTQKPLLKKVIRNGLYQFER